MRLLPALFIFCGLQLPAGANANPVTPPTANKQTISLTGLQPGKTTMRQAELIWQARQAGITSQQYGNALDSFYNGQVREVSNLRVVVSEVQGLAGLGKTRFSFFDGVLFRVSCSFAPESRYDDALHYLTGLYGAPMSSSQGQAYWQTGDVWVSLLADSSGQPIMQQEHRKLARQVRTSNVEVYAAYVVAKPPGGSILTP